MSLKSKIGLIGLAVMGSNFARNFASKGISISVYNRTFAKTQEFLSHNYENIVGFEHLKDFVESLERPRKIILLVKSGQPVDDFIEMLKPYLQEGDIILDCGNSNWHDTNRRQLELSALGLNFIGCGISGGEEGALHGPSIMPGGQKESVDHILPLLQKVSAKDFKGGSCVVNVGLNGSGHFVKMVHNGIEYAIMQAIAEIYDLLKSNRNNNQKIKAEFEKLNTGQNKSFLLDITINILGTVDDVDSGDLLDKIQFGAGAKGTGKWTVESAMDLGIAVPNVYAGLNARVMSACTHNFGVEKHNYNTNTESQIDFEVLNNLLETAYLTSYLQGLDLIMQANKDFGWQIDITEVCRIWQGGCIIRSGWLNELPELVVNGLELTEVLLKYKNLSIKSLGYLWLNNLINVPLPVINSSNDYLISLLSSQLPQNLTQAQRDYFGAHTYKRTDKEGFFTGGWSS